MPADFKQQNRGKMMISLGRGFLQPAKENIGRIIARPPEKARGPEAASAGQAGRSRKTRRSMTFVPVGPVMIRLPVCLKKE
jgi:hypothetical protein